MARRPAAAGTPPARPVPDRPPRIGFCRTVLWDDRAPAMRAATEGAAQRLGRAGAAARDVELPASFRALPGAHRQVSSFEFARNFTHEIERHWDRISETLRRGRIADGLACTFAEYRAARAEIDACRARLPEVSADIDIMITASAPEGLHATGSAAFGALFTPLALPRLTIPAFTGPSGMPMGLQVLASAGADDQLLDLARWVDRVLR